MFAQPRPKAMLPRRRPNSLQEVGTVLALRLPGQQGGRLSERLLVWLWLLQLCTTMRIWVWMTTKTRTRKNSTEQVGNVPARLILRSASPEAGNGIAYTPESRDCVSC